MAEPPGKLSAPELAALVSDKVELHKHGHDWTGLCPFHEEKTESFHVFQGRNGAGRFHCFGCNADGDSIDWARRMLGQSYRQAGGVTPDAKLAAELKAQRAEAHRRERVLNRFWDRNPDSVVPSWAIDTSRKPTLKL